MSSAVIAAFNSWWRSGMFSSSLKTGTMTDTSNSALAAATRPVRVDSATSVIAMNLLKPGHLSLQPSLEVERRTESQAGPGQGAVGKRIAGVARLRRPADDPGGFFGDPLQQVDDLVYTHTRTAAYVIDPVGGRLLLFRGRERGGDDVGHIRKVARLLAVPIDGQLPAVQQGTDELVKGHIGPLPGTVDREIAQRDGRHAEIPAVERAEMLGRELGDPVGRDRLGEGGLARRQGRRLAVDGRR